MDTIPEELLAEIFSWCDTYGEIGPFPARSPFRPETIPILNVCRSWRRVALSTPSLWHLIKILSSHLSNSEFRSHFDRFLRLSKNGLLDLDLCIQPVNIDGNSSLSQIQEELGRIRKISIQPFGRDVDVLQLMNTMDISNQLTSLTLLRVRAPGGSRQELAEELGNRKTICLPRLMDLTLSGAISDKLPFLSLPALKHLCLHNGSMEFKWIHTLVCSASHSLDRVLFKQVPVHSIPPTHLITPPVNLQSLTFFDLHLCSDMFMSVEVGLPFIQYQTLLIQHTASPFKLRFQGTPLPFFELAHSLSAVSLELELKLHFDRSPREEEQMAFIENEENLRRFLKGFPGLRELRASLDRKTRTSSGRTVFDDRSLLHRVFQELTSS